MSEGLTFNDIANSVHSVHIGFVKLINHHLTAFCFHTGFFQSDEASRPHLAAGGDAVVVTVNHRLNAFGYAWLKPFGARRPVA